MKYIKPFIILGILTLYISVISLKDYFSNISFTDFESERTKLIDSIESYQSIKEFKEYLKRTTYKYDVEKNYESTNMDKKPPFNTCKILIKNFNNIGYFGELWVLFFNNRLYSTRFYPQDYDGYIDALNKLKKINLKTTKKLKISTYTELYTGGAYSSKRFIGWNDIRLSKELMIWYKRYG